MKLNKTLALDGNFYRMEFFSILFAQAYIFYSCHEMQHTKKRIKSVFNGI